MLLATETDRQGRVVSREAGGVASDEARYRRAFERVPFGIVIAQVGAGPQLGTIVDVNMALCELLGYDRDALLGADLAILGHPEGMDAGVERFRRHVENGQSGYTV